MHAHTHAHTHLRQHAQAQSSQRASAWWKQAVSHQSHQSFALPLLTFTHSIIHSFISPPLLGASILSFIYPSLPSNPSFQPGPRLCRMIHVFILWWKDELNISCQSEMRQEAPRHVRHTFHSDGKGRGTVTLSTLDWLTPQECPQVKWTL